MTRWWKMSVLLLLSFTQLLIDVRCNDGGDDQSSSDNEKGDDVQVLTDDNFDSIVQKTPTILVEFYAPWCGHCKQLEPEYATAAKELLKNDPPVVLGKVDATVNTKLAERFKISGYPTLRFFKFGNEYEYDGPRKADGIVDYMKKRAKQDWEPEPDVVIDLNRDDFEEAVAAEQLMLVEFYAPWCGHCKRLAPVYERAAKQLIQENPPIKLAKIDAMAAHELASTHGVKGYPTLKVFRNGRPSEYRGQYQSEYDIISYMKNQVGDGAKEVGNAKLLKKFMAEDDITVVGFFEKDSPLQNAYKDVADDSRDEYKFAIVYDEATRISFKANPNSVIVFHAERFHTKFESKRHVREITKNTKSQDISDFITKNSLPLVGHYVEPQKARYDKQKPLCIVFYTVDFGFDGRSATQFWRNKIAEVAKKFPDIKFAVADDEKSANVFNEFGFGESGEEMNIGLFGSDGKKYAMDFFDEFESDDFIEFLEKYQEGKLAPFMKSERVPKKQTGPVTVVVGKTFEEIVMDPTKDVLLELYAPWCGHCKNLVPIYESLAKKLKNEKNLVIAKMDATANDLPDNYKVQGFPTIYFAPSNLKNDPLRYEGGRTVEDFEDYLKEQATVAFKGSKEEL